MLMDTMVPQCSAYRGNQEAAYDDEQTAAGSCQTIKNCVENFKETFCFLFVKLNQNKAEDDIDLLNSGSKNSMCEFTI